MFSQQEILDAWHRGKLGGPFYRLTSEAEVSFEYRGPQPGHPSNYASIRVFATPSCDFGLGSTTVYPPSVPVTYTSCLLIAIGLAAIDEFFASDCYTYRGCKLVVREAGWDEITSSEVAIYRAARGALSELRQNASWRLST